MMKHVFFACLFISTACTSLSQKKFVLIDPSLALPIRYTNTISANDIRQKLIPLEAKYLPQFISALETIKVDLDKDNRKTKAKNYHFGCTNIEGVTAELAKETRCNYTIKSNCDKMNTSFLLCDVKFINATNSFIVGTWIKYLKANVSQKH